MSSSHNSKDQYTKQKEVFFVMKASQKIQIEPFWLDEDFKTNDIELQKIMNLENKLMDEYIKNNPDFSVEVRESVAKKLQEVSLVLPDKYKLILKIGYRPVSVQYKLFDALLKYFTERNSELSPSEIKKMTLELVTHPDINIPPHSTGAAVDLTLFDESIGEYIDMGSPVNYPDDKSWTYNFTELTQEQIDNRKFLTNLMVSHGFANLASEWWHYSYGDPRWAVFYNKQSIYGVYDR